MLMSHAVVIFGQLHSHKLVFMKQVPDMKTDFILQEYSLNCWLIRCLSNWLDLVDLSQLDLDWRESSWNICDYKLQIVFAHLSNWQIIIALRNFVNFVASRVFAFTFCCAILWQGHVGDIRRTADGVKYVAASSTVSIWDYGSNGSLWVHPRALINIPPRSSALIISATIHTPGG